MLRLLLLPYVTCLLAKKKWHLSHYHLPSLLASFDTFLTHILQFLCAVSGLWGIFWFKEVQGFETIAKWFLSATLTVFGILLLSYEHHEK